MNAQTEITRLQDAKALTEIGVPLSPRQAKAGHPNECDRQGREFGEPRAAAKTEKQAIKCVACSERAHRAFDHMFFAK